MPVEAFRVHSQASQAPGSTAVVKQKAHVYILTAWGFHSAQSFEHRAFIVGTLLISLSEQVLDPRKTPKLTQTVAVEARRAPKLTIVSMVVPLG